MTLVRNGMVYDPTESGRHWAVTSELSGSVPILTELWT